MKIPKSSVVITWLPTLVWMAVIFGFSSRPSLHVSVVNWQDFIVKKSAHFAEYYILGLLVYNSLRKSSGLPVPQSLIISLIIGVIYAISDEFHQTFIPGREGRLRDVLIDSLGVTTALLTRRIIGL